MRIIFLNHASLLIENSIGEKLVTDPWYFDSVFNDSWELLDNSESVRNQCIKSLLSANYIWVSHEHPDHLHFPTLKLIDEDARKQITFLFRDEKKQNVPNALRSLGFNVLTIKPEETIEIGGFKIYTINKGYDTAIYLTDGETSIFNQNDCKLKIDQLAKLNAKFEKIDYYFYQFGLAGFYKNSDDKKGFEDIRSGKIASIQKYIEALNPGLFIPFASYIRFSHPNNQYLNQEQVRVQFLQDELDKIGKPYRIPTPMEDITSTSSLVKAHPITYWDKKLEKPYTKNLKAYSNEDLHSAILEYNKQIKKEEKLIPFKWKLSNWINYNLKLKGKWKLICVGANQLYVLEATKTGMSKVIHYSIRKLESQMTFDGSGFHKYKSLAETESADYIVDLDQVIYALLNPWGHDTLNISACFYIIKGSRGHMCSLFKRYYRK